MSYSHPRPKPDQLDWQAIHKRIDEIAETLGITEAEVKAAKIIADHPTPLAEFAVKHGQSLDWIICGDPRSMFLMLAKRAPGMFLGTREH